MSFDATLFIRAENLKDPRCPGPGDINEAQPHSDTGPPSKGLKKLAKCWTLVIAQKCQERQGAEKCLLFVETGRDRHLTFASVTREGYISNGQCRLP